MKGEQLPLSVQLRASASFEAYFAGSNQAAVELLQRFAIEGAPGGVFVYGAPGTGKTHLLQATARSAQLAGRRVAYLPLRVLGDAAALDGLQNLERVCLDDVEALGGEAALPLLRLLDRLRAQGHGWLAAAQSPPERLPQLLVDLRTRLSAGTVIGLKPLDDAERLQLLQRNARQRGLELSADVARWLLTQLPRDSASLLSVLDRLDAASLQAQRRLTLPFVQRVLAPPNRA